MATPRSVAFHTLGCKLNFSETSSIRRQFEDAGYAVIGFDDGADVYVINTCSVTDFADKKCRYEVRRALRHSPSAKIIIVGCYAQLKPKEIAEIEGVDLVLGAAEKFNILSYIDDLVQLPEKGKVVAGDVRHVDSFEQAFSFGDRTRSFLKVQDGCDYKCTFCTIPQARGRSRSDTVANVVANAQRIAELGIKEVVLTGVNIGDFGNGTQVIEGQRPRKEDLFIDLIKALDKVEGIERFRISSIEPNLCTDEIIDFVSSSHRFMPHLHMPLQSGSNRILALMKRRYKRELFAQRVEQIRKTMPHACIGVDVIVGFPGETEEDFMETYNFLHQLPISYLHVFTYSERQNTPAAEMSEVVPMHIRKERNKMLRNLSLKKTRFFYESHLGTKRNILVEQSSEDSILYGFTDNYIKVEMSRKPYVVNEIRESELLEIAPSGNVSVV